MSRWAAQPIKGFDLQLAGLGRPVVRLRIAAAMDRLGLLVLHCKDLPLLLLLLCAAAVCVQPTCCC